MERRPTEIERAAEPRDPAGSLRREAESGASGELQEIEKARHSRHAPQHDSKNSLHLPRCFFADKGEAWLKLTRMRISQLRNGRGAGLVAFWASREALSLSLSPR